MEQKKSFFPLLFDFSFTTLITPKLIKLLFGIVIIFVTCLLCIGLCLPGDALMALPKSELKKPPSYAGFTDIHPAKNCFVLVGDIQGTSRWEFWREKKDKERKLISDEIAKRDPAFVIHLGDLTTRGSSEKHWQEFDDSHRAFREKTLPFFPVLGNHEYYGNDETAIQNYFGRFPHLEKKRWYSFAWKNIAFIMTDSNFSNLAPEQIKEQSQWYLEELEKFEKKAGIDYVIVCCHHPPFTNSRVISPSQEVKTHLADPFLRFQKTQLFFSGHCHSYERFQVDGKFFIVSGGGGGPRHKLTTDPTKRSYQDKFEGSELRFFHFCEIEWGERSFTFKVIRLEQDGTFILADSLKILGK
jgi:predicted phosphodiesterase